MIELRAKTGDIEAKVTLHFEFEGDFRGIYGNQPGSEEEARGWVIDEIKGILEARASEQSQGQADTQDRGI